MILYSARTIDELKQYFEIYNWMKEKMRQSQLSGNKEGQKNSVNIELKTAEQSSSSQSADKKGVAEKRHHNYGSKYHLRSQCRKNEPKWFKCDQLGHTSTQCPGIVKKEVNCVSRKDPKLVTMNIDGHDFSVLIDTGADDNHIRIDAYEEFGRPEPLLTSNRIFESFGLCTIRPFGVISAIDIDHNGEVYRLKLFVVPIRAIKADFILGHDWMQSFVFIVDKGRIKDVH